MAGDPAARGRHVVHPLPLGEPAGGPRAQVDRLHLFLHGYDSIPEAVKHPRIRVYLQPRSHRYRASGKFYGLSQERWPCLYFCFDDDIIYRDGHVDRLRNALLARAGRAIVGVHGLIFKAPEGRFTRGQIRFHFKRGLAADTRVHALGSGTVGFYSRVMPIEPWTWVHGDMEDLMVAIDAARRNIPLVAVARPEASIVPVSAAQGESLWRVAVADDTRHTEQMRSLIGILGRRARAIVRDARRSHGGATWGKT